MPLRLENLCKRYGKKAVLDSFHYTFPEAGIVALMGPSGCGKTALLRLIAGLERPDGGTVRLPRGTKLSMVFQEDRLLPTLDVRGNLLAVLGGDTPENRRLAEEYLDRVGLEREYPSLPSQLSGGMKRRVAIARAVAYGGDILLLDEPFKGLDNESKRRVMDFALERKNRLTLLVTHNENEAARADIILRLGGPPLRIL